MTIEDLIKDTGDLGEMFIGHLNSYCLYEMPMSKAYAEFELTMIGKLYPSQYTIAKHLYDGEMGKE